MFYIRCHDSNFSEFTEPCFVLCIICIVVIQNKDTVGLSLWKTKTMQVKQTSILQFANKQNDVITIFIVHLKTKKRIEDTFLNELFAKKMLFMKNDNNKPPTI